MSTKDPIMEAEPVESHADWAARIQRERMVVGPYQARAALKEAGLLEAVELYMESSAGPLAALAWQSATEFRRMSGTVRSIGAALGISDEQLDELFRRAAQIEA